MGVVVWWTSTGLVGFFEVVDWYRCGSVVRGLCYGTGVVGWYGSGSVPDRYSAGR